MASKCTRAQVSEKSNTEAAFIIIDQKVYDITNYFENHPGGDDILVEVLGQDASEAFHEVGHSKEAHEQLRNLLVGELEAGVEQDSKFKPTELASYPAGLMLFAIVVLLLSMFACILSF
ncbi:putative cytochrome b5 [Paramyrothecium foliicola]|nr:putative cytochrome b5 [Paramyrothecium foliicola]